MATPVLMENDVNLESHTDKEAVAKPKRLHIKEKKGHLKVHKDGEMLYKKTPSSTLMESLQLGIQHAVGGLEPKPKRDLLMTDFEVVEVTDFPSGGSEFTLAHKHKDFRFKDYSPVAFRFFRDAFEIKPEDYMVSICHYPMTELSNPGASGSLFYRSADDEFIMKTVSKKEAEFLQKLLPGYYLNLTQNKRTLLPKFFGLYNYQSGGKNIRITVMNNLLPSTIEYHEKYDLKGSSYKRFASPEECSKAHPTYKDVDFQRLHPEGIILAADVYDQLISTVNRDARVLKSFGIMDYSMLVGIHNIDEELRRRDQAASNQAASNQAASNPAASNPAPTQASSTQATSTLLTVDGTATLPMLSRHQPSATTTDSPLQRSLTVRRLFSIIPETSQAQTPNINIEESTSTPYEVPPGGVMGRTEKGDRVLIFLGIIDILQSYRLRKKLEHTLKSVFTDGDTVSVHKPGFYMKRFIEHISTKVFKKEVKEKTKPKTRRSISGRPPGMRRQASLGSEDASNVRPQLARQRSLTSPERDEAKNQTSPPLLNDPPPVYTEKPAKSKSPEHLLVPRLSSVEEFQDEPVSPSVSHEESATHKVDHTPTTIATAQETVTTLENSNSELVDEPLTMTTNFEITNEPVTKTSSEADEPVTITTNEPVTKTSSEADEPVTITTNEPITKTSSEANEPVTITTASTEADKISSAEDVTVTTTQQEQPSNASNTNAVVISVEVSHSEGDTVVVDPGEVEVEVTTNDSV